MVPLNILNLEMILIFKLTYLDILHVFNFSNFLFQPLNLVNQLPILEVIRGGTIHSKSFIFIFPNLDLILFLIDEFCESFVFA